MKAPQRRREGADASQRRPAGAAPHEDADRRDRIAREDDGRLLVAARVTPRASHDALALEQDTLRVRLTAPPVEGAANEALIALLAARLRLPKRAIRLVRGATGRQKTVAIDGISAAEFWGRLGM